MESIWAFLAKNREEFKKMEPKTGLTPDLIKTTV